MKLTINQDPAGDSEYLGDRSLVAFLLKDYDTEWLYFSVYNYGFTSEFDSTNEYYKIDVTNYLTSWFYTYTAYSVAKQSAMVYVWMGDENNPIEISHQIKSLQFIPKYIGIYLGRS